MELYFIPTENETNQQENAIIMDMMMNGKSEKERGEEERER